MSDNYEIITRLTAIEAGQSALSAKLDALAAKILDESEIAALTALLSQSESRLKAAIGAATSPPT